MVCLVKCVTHKHESWSSDPRYLPQKLGSGVRACKPGAGEMATGRSLELTLRPFLLNQCTPRSVRAPEDVAHCRTPAQHACQRFNPQHCKANQTASIFLGQGDGVVGKALAILQENDGSAFPHPHKCWGNVMACL